jgi:hypothetical protein
MGSTKRIVYRDHAGEKFRLLRAHGFVVTVDQVKETTQNPEIGKTATEGERRRSGGLRRGTCGESSMRKDPRR